MTSVFEQILAGAKAALLAVTSAGERVERGRDVGYGNDELPALNLRRQDSSGTVIGANAERHILVFLLECTVLGGETEADALHLEAHTVLLADAQLAALGRGLRCLGTDLQTGGADQPIARLTARYQIQVVVRPGRLTGQIT